MDYFKRIFEQVLKELFKFTKKIYKSKEDFEEELLTLKDDEFLEWAYSSKNVKHYIALGVELSRITKKNNKYYHFNKSNISGKIIYEKLTLVEVVDLMWRNKNIINQNGLKKDLIKNLKKIN